MKLSIYQFIGFRYKSLQNKADQNLLTELIFKQSSQDRRKPSTFSNLFNASKSPLVKFHFLCSFSAFFASTSIEQVLQVMETLIHDWDIIIK